MVWAGDSPLRQDDRHILVPAAQTQHEKGKDEEDGAPANRQAPMATVEKEATKHTKAGKHSHC